MSPRWARYVDLCTRINAADEAGDTALAAQLRAERETVVLDAHWPPGFKERKQAIADDVARERGHVRSRLSPFNLSADDVRRLTAELTEPRPAPSGVIAARCQCGATEARFDPADANLDEYEVRRRWPRGHCSGCNCIVYASPQHFVAGDW